MSLVLERLAELAKGDASAQRLGPAERTVLARRWTDRSKNEQATSGVFAEIRRGLERLGAPPALVEDAARAIADERLHARICALCAAHYAGATVELPPANETSKARFAGCSPRDSALLYVVMNSCINEGIAAVYLQACLQNAQSALAREATRSILEDEVRHARLGWTFLAGRPPADRELIGEALPSLLATVLRGWIDAADYPQTLPKGHGCLDHSELCRVVHSAVLELILPGFEHVGVECGGARRALAASDYFGRLMMLPNDVPR